MFDTNEELINKIRLGEDSFLELKSVHISGKKITGPDRNSFRRTSRPTNCY
jgi:ATP-dependent DNA helicase RecG